LNKKLLVITILILFIGVSITPSAKNISIEKSTLPIFCDKQFDESVISSTDNFDENISGKSHILESVNSSENRFSYNSTSYLFHINGPSGTGFYAYYPNNTYNFREWEGPSSFSGGTWTNDGRYLCCEHVNGFLYDVDPETLEASLIGGGGVGLNGLAYDPVNYKLYGASSNSLYEIDINTGGQSYIGSFGIGTTMIAIAFDLDGICYGWNVLFSGESTLFKINTNTGEATVVGGMGYNLLYNQDGAFELDTDILYLMAYTSMGGTLLVCDEDTGECFSLGNFQGEATAHAISYGEKIPPVTNISFEPPEPDGCNGWYISNVTVILDATDESGVYRTFYRINGGDLEIYESPFIISEEGEDILIEYYSLDNMGNFEDIKSATLDIDKTAPEMDVKWDVEKIGWSKWRITFTINIANETSGIDRIEIFLNDALQDTITGPGPTYSWSFVISGDLYITLKFIAWDQACNQVIVIVNSSEINTFPSIRSNTYQIKSVGFSHFFERFPLIQCYLDILGWYS